MFKPVCKVRRAESCVISGNKCVLAQFHAIVAGLRVSDNLARMLPCGQTQPDEFIETKLFWPPNFNRTIHW